jgi:large subunit ribosomal protein L6
MSRVANKPVEMPKGVEVTINRQDLSCKGSKGSLQLKLHSDVTIEQSDNELNIKPRNNSRQAIALAGTMRSLVQNMVTGVSAGFEKKLELRGVGYRAQAQGNKINLNLGFSHPVEHIIPEGVKVETPSQTEIVISGIDKQQVGQVAADIRAYRTPEPYKGKGVRYLGEHVIMKEAKKK